MILQIHHKTSGITDVNIPNSGVRVHDLVRELTPIFQEKGEIITRLKLNGKNLDLTAENSSITVTTNDLVEVLTDSPISVIKNSLQDIYKEIPSFGFEINEITNDLIKGNRTQALSRFDDVLNGFRSIIQFLQVLEKTFSLDFSEILYKEDKSVLKFSEQLISVLSDIKTSMEHEDLVSLTDLLEYEIKGLLTEDLQQVVEKIQQLLSHVQ